MNFLRHFLQGKDFTTTKPGDENAKEEPYTLSRSATDPSVSVNNNRNSNAASTPETNGYPFVGETAVNNASQSASGERKLYKPYFSILFPDEKSYQERPSFKVESLLTQHLKSNPSQDLVARDSLQLNEPTSLDSDLSSLSEVKEFFDCEEQPFLTGEPPVLCLTSGDFADSLEDLAAKVASEAANFTEHLEQLRPTVGISPSKIAFAGHLQPSDIETSPGLSLSEIFDSQDHLQKVPLEPTLQYSTSEAVDSPAHLQQILEPTSNLSTIEIVDSAGHFQQISHEPILGFNPTETIINSEQVQQLSSESIEELAPLCESLLQIDSSVANDKSCLEADFDTCLPSKSEGSFIVYQTEPEQTVEVKARSQSKSPPTNTPPETPPKSLGRKNLSASKKNNRNRNKHNQDSYVTNHLPPIPGAEEQTQLTQNPPKDLESQSSESNNKNFTCQIESPQSAEIENQFFKTEDSSLVSPSFSEEKFPLNPSEKSLQEANPETNIEKYCKKLTNLEVASVSDIPIDSKISEEKQATPPCLTTEATSYFQPNISVEKTLSENESNSIISISCYGTEEFEVLGNEANKLAEELSTTASTVSLEAQKMEEKNTVEPLNTGENLAATKGAKVENWKKNIGSKVGKRENLALQVNNSEAGPDIAPGLTSSDLRCASQFFKEAAELESQIRRNIATSSSSLIDYQPEPCTYSESDGYSSTAKAVPLSSPPHEERSAPEGTSSPDPRSLEDSEVRGYLQTTPDCANNHEVNELLKKQASKFEEKLLRQGIVAAEKEKELHELLREEQKQMQKVTSSRDALLKLVEQYKGMLGSLLAEKEKAGSSQEEKIRSLESEKQQAIEDLNNVEAAFSDVHRKYERTKQIVDSLRRNEETLRNAVADYEEKLLKQERKFAELQKHAEEKVRIANEEFESLRRANDQEMTKMGALLKKAEMKIISLQDALERKTRENQELTQLCDDLISKVGS